MTNIRRYPYSGNVYFLTHVTYNRKPILIENVDLFWRGVKKARAKNPFDLIAWVILPEHVHMVVDPQDTNLSALMRSLKLTIAASWRSSTGVRSGRFWQYRFWDHIIRDQTDFNCHIDYIHYNPVKHGFVECPIDWQHSSFKEFLDRGYYSADWGVKRKLRFDGEFGE